MKNKSAVLYFLAVAFPVIILLSMSFLPVMTFFLGEEIIIETKPVDPRDLFRGDYVSLSFTINDVPASLFPEELKKQATFEKFRKKNLYAILIKQGDYYVVDKITLTKPNEQLYLKADFNLYAPINEDIYKYIRVNYQIDRYFVPENTGRDLEDLARKGDLIARVKVWQGYPLLIELLPKDI